MSSANPPEHKHEYLIAPPGWTPEADNPFSADGRYGPGCSCIVLRDGDEREWYGAGDKGLFALHVWAGLPGIRERVADFVRYENRHERIPIVAMPERLRGRRFVDEALSQVPVAALVRDSDPRWVVHSTSEAAWRLIQSDGALKALSTLSDRGAQVGGLGIRDLGEPPDFAEHVILGRIDLLSAEIVVSSQQKRRLCDDPDAPYEPGVRLYFDGHVIITSGLAVRDGRHTLKVHRRLPLRPFLVASIAAGDLVWPRGQTAWTPKTFTAAANAVFFNVIEEGEP